MNPLEEIIRTHIEIIGWIATFFILYSFFLDGRKMRVLNSIGAGIWVLYGLGIDSSSVIFLNGCVIGIHAWKLLSKRKQEKNKTD